MQTISQETKRHEKKNLLFSFSLFLILALTIFGIYCGYLFYRTTLFYPYIKTNQRGWSGNVHRGDAELGFAPVPNSQGAHIFPIGPEIPMRYDENGFRVPVVTQKSPATNTHPVILTLGCSFTYGDANSAEETYPYLVGQALGGTTKNAGVCGYGLAQMVLLARRLIPIHKPDYVLVQYSPWLAKRAQSPFASTYSGKIPTPFFSAEPELMLHPPVFATKVYDLSIDSYRKSPQTTADLLSFFWNVGFPLFLHDDVSMAIYYVKKFFGFVPKTIADREQIEKYAYGEIVKTAKENGAKVVVVILGVDSKPVRVPEHLFPDDCIFVEAHAALLERLPVVDDETYQKQYEHWRGSPPVMVDYHPNPLAHSIIAELIVAKIKNSSSIPSTKMHEIGTLELSP